MLKIENISASYHKIQILDGVSLQVEPGEFLGIIGPNGAGKTTLLKVISGVKKPVSGRVMLDGKDLASLSRKQIAKIMAVVPQSTFIPPLFTVEDVVLMGRYAYQKSRFITSREDIEVCEEAMKKTDTLSFRNRLISELSGGERQEVIIARALVQQPKILILDEPTASLDIRHQMRILGRVKALVKESGITAIMVIHDLNLASRCCDRLILLHNQKVYSEGSPSHLLTPKNIEEVYGVKVVVEYQSIIDAWQIMVIEEG
ncbi:MAG: ABC transporter ATP-binding protein [Candidatus Desantisbacteria bacterium]